jgi:filamentous hemagglutinin family protein
MMKELRKISNKYYLRQIVSCWLMCYMLFCFGIPARVAMAVDAVPGMIEGQNVTYGSANFSTGVNTATITTGGAQTIIEYNKFNINGGWTVHFAQPSDTAATLNRIIQANPSMINGNLTSNGRIFIVNPAGIIFGGGASVDVAQLVASGLNITNSNFLENKYIFEDGLGDVTVNNGAMLKGSQIMLVGKSVFNDGTLTRRDTDSSTYVIMGAGDTVKFFQPGSDVIIEAANPADRKIVNNGNINTNGGDVLLGAGDIYTKAIDNLDTLTAKSLGNITVDGAINATGDLTLFADYDHQDGGDFLSTADAPLTSQQGNIEIRGNNVDIGAAVEAGGNLTIVGRDCQPPPQEEWGNVYARSTLTAGGDITISDTGKNQEWVDGY